MQASRRISQPAAGAGRRRADPVEYEIFEHLPLTTLVARASDHEPLYASPQVELLLGVTPSQALAEHDFWDAHLHEDDRESVQRAWRAWLSDPGGEPFRCSYRMVGEHDRVVWVQDVTTLVPPQGIRPATFQRHLLDVSAQRQLEEQLRDTQRLELLGRLSGGVAHDFNNLLAVIAGYAERLGSPLPHSARDESVFAISAAAQRGASLVRQLLAFARPQSAEPRLVDLNELIRDFAPMLRRVIGEDVVLELRLAPAHYVVEVTPVEIDQVLLNLVVNARDAMPHGGRVAIATAAADGEAGRAARVTVSDTGSGMTEATRDRIFEPFFSTKDAGVGSGLGLTTAVSIVRAAGGSITVASTPGEGSTFAVELPLAAGEVRAPAEPTGSPQAPRGGSETVLLVEDDPGLRELEQVMLEGAGYDVLAAGSASEALAAVGRRRFDVLVVDVVMPGMNGPQLAVELAARGHGFPTVFVSGYGDDELATRGIAPDAAAVVGKPFQGDQLLNRVREVLDAATSARTEPRGRSLHRVRCLACRTAYTQPDAHDLLVRAGCPNCGYLGWTGAA
jgi:signal transduction histidine kinase/CheY-like chemotaxis protein